MLTFFFFLRFDPTFRAKVGRDMVRDVMNYIESTVRSISIYEPHFIFFVFQFKLQSLESCITFENIDESQKSRNDFVLITADGGGIGNGPDCFSQLGRQSGEQILNLDSACLQTQIVLHELVHTLGCIFLFFILQHCTVA